MTILILCFVWFTVFHKVSDQYLASQISWYTYSRFRNHNLFGPLQSSSKKRKDDCVFFFLQFPTWTHINTHVKLLLVEPARLKLETRCHLSTRIWPKPCLFHLSVQWQRKRSEKDRHSFRWLKQKTKMKRLLWAPLRSDMSLYV